MVQNDGVKRGQHLLWWSRLGVHTQSQWVQTIMCSYVGGGGGLWNRLFQWTHKKENKYNQASRNSMNNHHLLCKQHLFFWTQFRLTTTIQYSVSALMWDYTNLTERPLTREAPLKNTLLHVDMKYSRLSWRRFCCKKKKKKKQKTVTYIL